MADFPTSSEQIEDSFQLSPLQHGMLFHSLLARGSGVDIVQEVSAFSEDLDVDAFERAWKRVARRHPMLRTSFQWEGPDEPIQQVHTSVPSLERHDWRDRSGKDQEAQLQAFLLSDRRRDFDLHRAPLMRLAVFRLAPSDYRFVWTFHHAVLDGWCIPIVLKDVFAFYDAFRQGNEEPTLDEPLPYRDYIDWLQNLDLSRAERFWRERLRGFRAPTPLAVDRLDDGLIYDPPHGEEEIRLSGSLTSALRSLAREHDLTLNTLLQAAWACLLSRYSGEDDVVFGATRQCRPSAIAGAESVVGLFINTLPIRARLAPDRSVLDLLKELRSQWILLREYKHTPLVDIQSWSEIPRGAPLFESILVFENSLLNSNLRAQGGPWTNRTFRYDSQPNTPLNVVAYGERELLIRISYDRKRFDSDSVSRMLGHVATLLEGMAAGPETPLSRLPMLSESERRQVLVEWNDSAREYPRGKTVHELFEEQVEKTPEAEAVVFGEERLTYGQLNERVNRLARYLSKRGVGPEVLVGLCVERSLEMVVGLLGILKAGGAYVPLDPAYPRQRLAFMLEDTAARVVLTQESLCEILPGGRFERVRLDADWPEIAQESGENPPAQTSPDNLAYVIYTSGSTGKPKGVLISHRNVVRLFDATQQWFGFDQNDVWTLFHSYAFDFSVWELWGALLHGGRLVVVPYLVSRSPEDFYRLLRTQRVTVLNQTPSAFLQLLPVDAAADPTEDLALRLIIFGGEALDIRALKPWFNRHGEERPRLVNMYGITETTVHVTYRPLTAQDAGASASVLGRPIPDLQLYILDRGLEPIPLGVCGEMYVGGAGLARGYLNRPELTAERFLPDPFCLEPGARIYRTGDLARRRPDGDVEYLGRKDDQVKIRGFRIEPGEIQSALAEHPLVRESVVIVREGSPGEKRLLAYIVPAAERVPVGELRDFLRKTLPDYMVPSAFVFLDALPLTPNGKVDRQALPAPEQTRPELEAVFVAPRNAVEQTVAGIWAQVLGLEKVGIHDDFFELGGHSLLATQVVSRVRDSFGFELPLRALFESSTLAALASVVEEAKRIKTQPESPGPVPLSRSPRRIHVSPQGSLEVPE